MIMKQISLSDDYETNLPLVMIMKQISLSDDYEELNVFLQCTTLQSLQAHCCKTVKNIHFNLISINFQPTLLAI